ncbi:hypothetical protein Mboo_1364 [Methanoregula boonei 6A8]|jgi:hypothetical protein|uniref:Zinc-ribbon domain-containing protein n=1 Tax=Methanoregula boonei (strain DSM 21154 / JCM 14090 / 6A8) TaxID=456442 RepID=A7I821_METB6|nr:hypothetical protein [Methanoregula boonei]ABS55882.1 hypothetical protein Mboo_1364 [Methanoregula boonei 6A8]
MATCPHCGREYFSLNIDCPHCGKRIVNYFTINAFFRDNFHYFTIIGVTGTMIALLPNLGENIIGTDWISDNMSLLSASLAFLFIFGALLLFGIFIILLKKIWSRECHSQEDPVFNVNYLRWLKKGDKSRLMLSFCLFPMMIALIGFLILILIYNPSSLVRVTTLIVAISIFVIAYGYYISSTLVLRVIRLFIKNWKHGLGFIVICAFLGVIYISLFSHIPPPSPPVYPVPQEVNIIASPSFYDPQISSDKGLLLEATETQEGLYGPNQMHWKANYGYFIQIEPGNKVILLGNDTIQKSTNLFGDQTIFWVYPTSDLGKVKPSVNISLNIVSSNNAIITNSSLKLKWMDRDVILAS